MLWVDYKNAYDSVVPETGKCSSLSIEVCEVLYEALKNWFDH